MEDRNLYGKAVGLDQRGRHRSFGSAVDAAFKDLATERNDFFDSLADRWAALFPGVPAVPGRYDGGIIFLYDQVGKRGTNGSAEGLVPSALLGLYRPPV